MVCNPKYEIEYEIDCYLLIKENKKLKEKVTELLKSNTIYSEKCINLQNQIYNIKNGFEYEIDCSND